MHFLLLGIDSLIAGAAICLLVHPRSRLRLAALFGAADAVGFLIGAGLGWQISEGMAQSLQMGIILTLGFYLLVVAAGTRRVAAAWPVWVLPWTLTLDNLAYGLAGEGTAGSLLGQAGEQADRKSTRLNSSHANISYAVFCLKKKKNTYTH